MMVAGFFGSLLPSNQITGHRVKGKCDFNIIKHHMKKNSQAPELYTMSQFLHGH
jgi:hypothetical protein